MIWKVEWYERLNDKILSFWFFDLEYLILIKYKVSNHPTTAANIYNSQT